MRVLFVVGPFPLLSETFILDQITGLIDRGHEVDIYSTIPVKNSTVHFDVEKYKLLDHTYYRGRIPRRRVLRLLKGLTLLACDGFKGPATLLRWLNLLKYGTDVASTSLFCEALPLIGHSPYDIIHCHFGTNGNRGALLREIGALHGKLVTTFHAVDLTVHVKTFGHNLYDRLFDSGDLFLPISHRWKQRLIELGCDEQKILVHRMGVDCNKFIFIPRKLDDNSRVRLVSVARLVEKKGLEYGIRAVSKLKREYPKIEYTIVGDGPLKENLQSLVQDLHVTDIVHLVGWKEQRHVIEILEKAHILLAPSVTDERGDQEGIPVVLMEAMAMGLPIVSTQHSGIPELIDDGVSGYLVPERNAEALFHKLKYLLENPHVWPKMGRHGRKHVQRHHDINKLNDRLVETFQTLLE